jgi:hypothetical protein
MLYDGPRRNERDYPHVVEISVPGDGLGSRLNDMHAWHRARSLEARRGHGRTDVKDREVVSYIRWCFKDPEDAEEFQRVFGGVAAVPERSLKN